MFGAINVAVRTFLRLKFVNINKIGKKARRDNWKFIRVNQSATVKTWKDDQPTLAENWQRVEEANSYDSAGKIYSSDGAMA